MPDFLWESNTSNAEGAEFVSEGNRNYLSRAKMTEEVAQMLDFYLGGAGLNLRGYGG